MLDRAREALDYARDKSRVELDADPLLAHALVRCLEVLGEAGAQVSDVTRSALPAIPWRAIVSMRNRLIRAYHDIDLDIVWKAVTESLPPLTALEEALAADGL
jgi:uncharacterized protein with HEPN domain